MKCISIKQPWAWLIFNGKPVENRAWWSRYRGPLLIHASKTYDEDGDMYLHSMPIFHDIPAFTFNHPARVIRGVIIGMVNMVDCVTTHPSRFFFGPYGHVYSDQVMFREPIPYRGYPGLFDVPDELIKEFKNR
jgi:hypothetical protein